MKKILIVDDSATSRAIFKASVPAGEFEVFEASDAPMAVEQAQKAQPDLCVMDYNLPDKNGTEIAEDIINSGFTTEFILMTANMQQSVVDRAKNLGFKAFVEKPINPGKVKDVLKEIGWLS